MERATNLVGSPTRCSALVLRPHSQQLPTRLFEPAQIPSWTHRTTLCCVYLIDMWCRVYRSEFQHLHMLQTRGQQTLMISVITVLHVCRGSAFHRIRQLLPDAITFGGNRQIYTGYSSPVHQNLVIYQGVRCLGKVYGIRGDGRLIRALFGRGDGCVPRGRPPITWTKYVCGDLLYLSELHGVFGTYIGCWSMCKGSKLNERHPQGGQDIYQVSGLETCI